MGTANLILLPLISAFIGWFTNWIAIKMLFHPKQPKRILGVTFHGIFPKRQQQFARKLGAVVASELLHFNDIAKRIADPVHLEKVKPFISEHIDNFLQHKLAEKLPVLSMFIGPSTLTPIKEGLIEEIDLLLPQLMERYAANLSTSIDIERMVVEKVEGFSSDKLEELLVAIMSKEFRFVELIGAVLGLVIGIIQILLTRL
ncbi:DUF445 domain-containing protein [Rurimicrobium arvi]|uniref:DUF445 family protein n=1 Tax=Rurimicrobium arvi TaxID=2049916 RepID=A0ABP8MZS7_9BACT